LYVVLLLRFGRRSSVVHLCFASTSTVVYGSPPWLRFTTIPFRAERTTNYPRGEKH